MARLKIKTVFVLESKGIPAIAFEADTLAKAQQVPYHTDVMLKLFDLQYEGQPVLEHASDIRVRIATEEEAAFYRQALNTKALRRNVPNSSPLVLMQRFEQRERK